MTDDEYINPWFRVAAYILRRRAEDAGERWSLREAIDFGTIMANLGRGLAVGGALCAAHELAEEPVPTRKRVLGTTKGGGEMVTFEPWSPGCGWAPSEASCETYSSCPTCGGPISSAFGGCLGGDRGCGYR